MIKIFDAIFLLALDDEEGEIVETASSVLESALAGAVLAELVLENRVTLTDNRVVVSDPTLTENPILDKALFDIIDASRPRKIKYWINTLTFKKILDEVGHQLVDAGVLVRKRKHLLLVIPAGESRAETIPSKYGLKNRLREIVLMDLQPELSEKVLLAFLYHCDLLKLVFTHGERKAAQKRVKKLVANEEEGTHLTEALDEILAIAC